MIEQVSTASVGLDKSILMNYNIISFTLRSIYRWLAEQINFFYLLGTESKKSLLKLRALGYRLKLLFSIYSVCR